MTAPTFSIGTRDRETLVAAGIGPAAVTVAPSEMASPVNLVRSSRIPPDDTDGRWVDGFSYLPEGVGVLTLYDYCSAQHADIVTTAPFVSDWQPYVLSAQFTCSTFGFQEADYWGRAQRLLDAATPKLLEREFWAGTLSNAASLNNTWLEKSGVSATAVTDILVGLAVLKQGLGDCAYGGRGTIHMPAGALAYAMGYGNGYIRREGNLLLTGKDTIVVPGSGYPMTGNKTFDMFATGLTDVRLSDVWTVPDEGNMGQAIDKSANTMVIKAERYGIVSWDELCRIKVTVTLP